MLNNIKRFSDVEKSAAKVQEASSTKIIHKITTKSRGSKMKIH